MSTALKPLSEAVLSRLTNDALTAFLGEAALFEAAARPGLQLALSNEPVADLNMLTVAAGADHEHFRDLRLQARWLSGSATVSVAADRPKCAGDPAVRRDRRTRS